MDKKYTALMVNNLFDGDNLLIVKSNGEQIIVREKEPITAEYAHNYLERNGIKEIDYRLVALSEDLTAKTLLVEHI